MATALRGDMSESKLSVGTFGEDVKLLHDKLQKHGFKIPQNELDRNFFGPATRQAVQQLQERHGLTTTGAVDDRTLGTIDTAIAAKEAAITASPTAAVESFASSVAPSGFQPPRGVFISSPNGPEARGSSSGTTPSSGSPDGLSSSVTPSSPPQSATAQISASGASGPTSNDGGGSFQAGDELGTAVGAEAPTGDKTNTPVGAFHPPQNLIVRGQIRQADGSVFVGGFVRAVDKELRSETPLGEAITGKDGRYEIAYTSAELGQDEKPRADLIVRVFSARPLLQPFSGADTELPAAAASSVPTTGPVTIGPAPLATSAVIFNAPPVAIVDLMIGGGVYAGPSEYEQLAAAITPALQGLNPAELTDDDVSFLAGETGLPADRVGFFANAARLAQQTDVAPEAFYGFARQRLPDQLGQILFAESLVLQRALEASIAANIIPRFTSEWIAGVLERLRRVAAEHTLAATSGGRSVGALGFLRMVISDGAAQKDFATAYLAHQGPMPAFWAGLRQDSRFAPLVPKLQRVFQLGALTRNHEPLVTALESRFQAGQFTSTGQMLAAITEADWRGLMDISGTPPEVPGTSADEKKTNYIKILSGIVEASFPTHYLSTRLGGVNIDNQEHVSRFLSDHADQFNIRTDVLDKFLRDNPSALADAPARTEESLRTVQRLYKIAPHAADMQAVAALPNVRSARDIVSMGREAFTSAVGSTTGPDRAQGMYESATWSSDAATVLMSQFSQAVNPSITPSVGSPITTGQQGQIPNFQSLFGSLDFCTCEECRSVYSPAAYLTDLLAMLDSMNVGKTSMMTKFLYYVNGDQKQYRRSDIGEILLNCNNTNTPLPYIDLVNEILEYVTVGTPPPPGLLETSRTAAELAITPEHVLSAAYDILANNVYPWDLPFHLGIEAARTFLGQLGVSRAELLEKLQQRPSDNKQPFNPTDYEIAAEYLGLTPGDRAVLTGTDGHKPPDYWNLSNIANGYTIVTPDGGIEVTNDLLEVLRYAREFLARSGLSPQDFLELKDTHFVSKTLGGIGLNWPDTDCSLDRATIQGLDQNSRAQRIHRFLRLQRKLGWTIRELDQVARVFSSGDFGDPVLLKLSYLQRLRERLNLSLPELLAWWGEIDTSIGPDKQPSFYDLVFPRTADLADDTLALNVNRDELAKPDTLHNHLAEVSAGIGITIADLGLLIGTLAPDQLNLANLSLLYRIASLCRATGLSILDFKSLKNLIQIDPFDLTIVSAWQYLDTLKTIADSGFSIPELDYLLRHVYQAASGIAPDDEAIAIVLTELRDGLRKIARETGYPVLDASTPFPPPDPKGDLAKKYLPAVLPADSADRMYQLLATGLESAPDPAVVHPGFAAKDPINIPGPFTNPDVPRYLTLTFGDLWDAGDITVTGTNSNGALQSEQFTAAPGKTVVGVKDFKTVSAVSKALSTAGAAIASIAVMSKSVADVNTYITSSNGVIDVLFGILEPNPAKVAAVRADARSNLVDDGSQSSPRPHPGLADPVLRFAYLLEPLLKYLSRTRSENLVNKKIGEALKLEIKTAILLLGVADPATNLRYLDQFLNTVAIQSPDTISAEAPGFFSLFDTYRLLDKSATLIGRFRIGSDELASLLTSPIFETLRFNDLPVQTVSGDAFLLFSRWLRLAELFALRNRLPAGKPSLVAIMASVSGQAVPAIEQNLATLTGWDKTDIGIVAAALGLVAQVDFADVDKVRRLKDAFDLLKRLGLPASKVLDWVKPAVTLAVGLEMRNAVKSRFEPQQWSGIAKPLQDSLREKQRSALVSYITGRDNITSDELFDRYLIDVEMSSCQLTSRIKQAIGSVQLFVQRTTMGLETWTDVNGSTHALALGKDGTNWWNQWMRSYRVWEANRKIFLYTENWLEPELLDNKTPFFQDLEKSLTHGDITPGLVQDAYLKYLESLEDVAFLDVRGLYQEDQDADILHVFARTRGTPHIYFYRQRIDSRFWTPWLKMDLDISGDHVIPVVYQHRPLLFWPIIAVKQVEPKSSDLDQPKQDDQRDPPPKYLEIQLAYSEYKNGKWTAKKVTKETMATNAYVIPIKPSQLEFSAVTGDLVHGVLSSGDHFVGEDTDLWIICRTTHAVGKQAGWFIFSGSGGGVTTQDIDYSPGDHLGFDVITPAGTAADGMEIVQDTDANQAGQLVLYKSNGIQPLTVLGKSHGKFHFAHRYEKFQYNANGRQAFFAVPPLFYTDDRRSYAIYYAFPYGNPTPLSLPDEADPAMILNPPDGVVSYDEPGYQELKEKGTDLYQFQTFYHPYAGEFIGTVRQSGVELLLTYSTQSETATPSAEFPFSDPNAGYDPQLSVYPLYPRQDVDFTSLGAYSQYNWELFFHAPLMIANRLSKNQQFEEARRWFHFIFDPTDPGVSKDVQSAWRFKPFKDRPALLLQELLALLDYQDKDPVLSHARAVMESNVTDWRNNPFSPHRIARHRYGAYMQTVVMKYLDNLIAWGDQLFRRDTLESINEATQIYILAQELLGPRPQELPARGTTQDKTYNTLRKSLDAFSNALVTLEGWVPPKNQQIKPPTVPLPPGTVFYFCIPPNAKLLAYWDTIADRLFKIRHCRNIEGVFQQLPLFEPPIDAGLLARAKAAGVDLSSALSDSNTALPHYRFAMTVQKAIDFCADVRSLGAALLAALEKNDAETLGLMRSTHELTLLTAVRDVKQRQVDEAQATLDGLTKGEEAIQARYLFYSSRDFVNAWEVAHLGLTAASAVFQEVGAIEEAAAAVAHVVPNFHFGPAGWASSPTFLTDFGGQQIGTALQSHAANMKGLASLLGTAASLSAAMGGYRRRQDDWNLQKDLAAAELGQIAKQILAAEIRLDIAQKDLDNHDLQTEHTQQVDSFLRDKFTNEELYDWMVTQLAGVYFQSYQLAYDLARRAEKTYQFERGDPKASFIQFGYWDSLKKGLLAGERLHYDLRRMDAAFLDENKREFEITKQVSLVMNSPMALIALKETGRCVLDLPEAFFDTDYPGLYMRRIKNIALTIPCVTGPYTSVNCTLTLLKSSIRQSTAAKGLEGKYARDVKADDPRFVDNFAATESIATSTAQNDSGMFEVNFRDERYLPFEGGGAVSRWRIELPKETNAFDFNTLSDVVLHLKYTAREGGEILKRSAKEAIEKSISDRDNAPLARLFSAKHEFPTEWYRFLHPTDSTATSQTLQLDLTKERFPFQFRGKTITISQVTMFLKLKEGFASDNPLKVSLGEKDLGEAASPAKPLGDREFNSQGGPIDELPFCRLENTSIDIPKGLVLMATKSDLADLSKQDAIEDIWIVFEYSAMLP